MILRVERPERFRFAPGQRVKLSLGGKKRPYNIASAPDDPYLELCVERVSSGRLTPRLWRLPVGAPVELKSRAKGRLVFEPDRREQLMVATVTGVAPFRSMLRHALGAPGRQRFTLLHGARHVDELAYREELEALAATHPDRLRYLPVVSRPEDPRNAGWTGETGRVSERAALLAPALDPHQTQVYACGHPGMIADVRLAFRRRDFPVRTEAFWKV